jgi:hypothetical protein
MNNLLAGTPSGETSDLYPDQRLTTQALHADYGYTSCDVCNLIPQPTWAYGSCQACERYQAPVHYYPGADVGDPRMTGTQGFVPLPNQYAPPAVLRAVQSCDIRTVAADRGASWQNYNLSSTCGGTGKTSFE